MKKNWKTFVIIKIPEREIKGKEESHGENWDIISLFRDLEMKDTTYEREGGKKTWKIQKPRVLSKNIYSLV